MQNATFGTYIKNPDNLSFFLQYQFPRFYAGMCVEYPLNEMLITSDQVNVELSFGLNLGKNKQSAATLKIPPPLFGSEPTMILENEETAQDVPVPRADMKAAEHAKKKPEQESHSEEKEIAPEKTREEQKKMQEEITATKEHLDVVQEKLVELQEDLINDKEEQSDIKEEPIETGEEPGQTKAEEQVTEPETEKLSDDPVKEEKNVVVFRVQITSSTKPVDNKQVVIDGKSYELFEYYYVGAYRQCVGSFPDLDEAITFQNRCRALGFNQAFVAAFINNERITDPAVFRR
jgi:hypothetical protein